MVAYNLYLPNLKRTVFFSFLLALICYPVFSPAQSGRSTFSARLINIEAAANASFSYNASLKNGTASSQYYNFSAKVPDGWTAVFRVEGSQVAAFKLDSNKTEEVAIQITPAPNAKPGKYEIPVTAFSAADSVSLNLEAVVTGAYKLELSTPTGRLSDEITEGSDKEIILTVTNSGTIDLNDVQLSAQTPAEWQATFEPAKIDHLEAGKTVNVTATLKVPGKTITGDYVTTFSAKTSNANADAAFRMTVKTSLLSGWIGILIILIAIGIIYYLIRKYGRR
ncbi:MAG: NEW3 domain-containing protein [Arachidicoccus sp.]|nr:NEW3 domain-containing protein [Arachidicoccus sp.]